MENRNKDTKLEINIWNSFIQSEKTIAELLISIPYDNINKKTWSPILANTNLEICSQIDSIFKNFISDEMFTQYKTKKKHSMKQRDLNIEDFRCIYNSIYKFHKDKIYLLDYREEFIPWKNWENQNPRWWKTHNEIKHDRFKYLTSATFENVINSLAGLFNIIIRNKNMIPLLIDKSVIQGDNEPSYIKYHMLETVEGEKYMITRPVIAKTNLLGYVYNTWSTYCTENPWECLTGCGRPGRVTDQIYSY